MLLLGGKTQWPRTRGAQLLEVALVLPLLLILAVGILDFGTAYNLRHILNNAAREGARLGTSQPSLNGDLTKTQPPSVQAICNDVVAYLWQANVNLDPAKSGTSFLGPLTAAPPPLPGQPTQPPTCPAPTPATSTNCPAPSTTTFTWVYPSGISACGTGLTIEREISVPNPGGGPGIPSTRVTLNYPYNWLYGFNNVIGFFGGKYSGTIQIYTNAVMANLFD